MILTSVFHVSCMRTTKTQTRLRLRKVCSAPLSFATNVPVKIVGAKLDMSKIQRLWLASVAEQAGLSMTCEDGGGSNLTLTSFFPCFFVDEGRVDPNKCTTKGGQPSALQ